MKSTAEKDFEFDYPVVDQNETLDVRAEIWDTTNPLLPILLDTAVLVHLSAGVYITKYLGGMDGQIYTVIRQVFTDNSFTAVNPDYPSPSVTLYEFEDPAPPPTGGAAADTELVGFLDDGDELIGILDCDC